MRESEQSTMNGSYCVIPVSLRETPILLFLGRTSDCQPFANTIRLTTSWYHKRASFECKGGTSSSSSGACTSLADEAYSPTPLPIERKRRKDFPSDLCLS